MPTHVVDADSRRDLLVAVMKHDTPIEDSPDHSDDILFVERKSHGRMRHIASRGKFHFTILHMEPRRGKQIMVSAMVVMHMRDQDILHVAGSIPTPLNPSLSGLSNVRARFSAIG